MWLVLCALAGLNISLWASKPLAHYDKVFQIFTHPFSAVPHDALAQVLVGSGAKREHAIVAELSPVLGTSSKEEAQREEEALVYWQNMLTSHPDYRDAYIQLASLSWREGNITQAHAYLLKAQLLDPNNATVNRLVAFTSKVLE